MSIKKAISLSFLLFANVVILAHSVIFHHHDSQIPCNENTEQHHCCDDTGHTGKCCDSKNCLLDTPFTRNNDSNQLLPVFNNFDFVIINIVPANQIIQITDLTGLPLRQRPYPLLFYSGFISQSMGLRAPPVC